MYKQKSATTWEASDSSRGMWPTIPSLGERRNLLYDFLEVHRWSFQKAATSAIFLEGGRAENFDYDKRYLICRLSYRRDSGGNPSLAFRIENAAFRPLSEILEDPRMAESLEAGRTTRELNIALIKAESDDFLGLLLVLYRLEDFAIWEPIPQHTLHPIQTQPNLRDFFHGKWLDRLKNSVDRGHVMRKVDSHDTMWKIGILRKIGNKWQWVQLTPDELEAEGFKRDFPGHLC
jgi:hypothetical protein